jgi:hypothetical protein
MWEIHPDQATNHTPKKGRFPRPKTESRKNQSGISRYPVGFDVELQFDRVRDP